jgi:hypothetical protein
MSSKQAKRLRSLRGQSRSRRRSGCCWQRASEKQVTPLKAVAGRREIAGACPPRKISETIIAKTHACAVGRPLFSAKVTGVNELVATRPVGIDHREEPGLGWHALPLRNGIHREQIPGLEGPAGHREFAGVRRPTNIRPSGPVHRESVHAVGKKAAAASTEVRGVDELLRAGPGGVDYGKKRHAPGRAICRRRRRVGLEGVGCGRKRAEPGRRSAGHRAARNINRAAGPQSHEPEGPARRQQGREDKLRRRPIGR